MMVSHRTIVLLRIGLATGWALSLVLAGMWVLMDWTCRFPAFERPCWLGGITLIAMGEFVFATLVADWIFPRAHPILTIPYQLLSALVYVCGVVTVVLLISGMIA